MKGSTVSPISPEEVPDTRGRPRSMDMNDLTDQIEKAYMTNKLPVRIDSDEPKKLVKRLRMAASFIEMQEEVEVKFRILVMEDHLICTLRKGK